MQRVRVRFGRGEDVWYISHLDTVRFWERAFRRAGVRLAYSQGYTPRPRMSFAAPLALGVTSEAELMDVWLRVWMPPQSLLMSIRAQLPPGFCIYDAWEVPLGAPSVQSCVAMAEYRVKTRRQMDECQVRESMRRLLDARELPWQHRRGDEVRSYDLRPLVHDVWLEEAAGPTYTLAMRLRCDQSGSGRPEQVAAALGFSEQPLCIHRTRLALRGE